MTDIASLIAELRKKYGDGPARCWIWPRALDKTGRGRIWIGKTLMIATRAVWRELRGPIQNGKLLCHHCDNPSCVNPDHLYTGTHADNMRDMAQRKRSFGARNPEKCREMGRQTGLKNTWAVGERNPKAVLTETEVARIRASKEPTKQLAAFYEVNRTTIQRIRGGTAWKT